jgi:hypothetical protein
MITDTVHPHTCGEFKAMGYIADRENGYIITDAGRIASI